MAAGGGPPTGEKDHAGAAQRPRRGRAARRYESLTERFGYGKLELLYELLEELVEKVGKEEV